MQVQIGKKLAIFGEIKPQNVDN